MRRTGTCSGRYLSESDTAHTRNEKNAHRATRKRCTNRRLALLPCLLLMLLTACHSIKPREGAGGNETMESAFRIEPATIIEDLSTTERVKSLETREPFQYRLGPGDRISIQVWRRPELSQDGLVVSPDGLITIPRIGNLEVLGKTVNEAQKLVTTTLGALYTDLEVTIRINEFHNNKAYVLGRVSRPGVVNFSGQGTLLEALAQAGGIPDQSKSSSLNRCAIIRGNDTIIWIDLEDLLRKGNMVLNAPIRNNDVIYIPQASDEVVYVLGEVITPGAIQIRSGMSVLKAIMLAGGITKNADPEKVFIIRQQNSKGDVAKVNLKTLLEKGDFSQNYSIMPNDIIYISPGGMARFNYALEKVLPSMQMLNLGMSNLESLGVMQELRQKIWGQEGFVSGTGTD